MARSAFSRHGVAAAVMCVMLVMTGCADPEPVPEAVIDLTIEDADLARSTWVNQTGIDQPAAGIWQQRVDRACVDGVWDDDVALALADEFVAADLEAGLSRRADGSVPSPIEAADALWVIAAQVCSDRFPAGALELGPPGVRSQ